jgi:hypothetical protein
MNDLTPGNTLLSRSKELSDKMKRIANRAADDVLVRKIEEIHEPLTRHVATVVGLHSSLLVMRKAELLKASPVSGSTVQTLQQSISNLRKRLRENRSRLVEGNIWANCDKQQKAHAEELERLLQQQWKSFVTEHTPGIETFRPFAKLTSCKSKFDRLEELERESRVVQAHLPSSEAVVEAVRQRGAQMNQLIDSLGLDGEPAKMQDFLKQCAQSGVPLDELTDDVLKWLKTKGFAASLRIVTR